MSERSPTVPFRPADHLQRLTEILAAAQTQNDVLMATSSPAITALNALAATVLLLDSQSQGLTVAALQGTQAQTVWQDSPLTQGTPASDVLVSGEPLYFERAGTLKAAYPDLEATTGGVTAAATAVLLHLNNQPLGVPILDLKEPHEFTAEERRFLAILATQGSEALDRARLILALRGQVQQVPTPSVARRRNSRQSRSPCKRSCSLPRLPVRSRILRFWRVWPWIPCNRSSPEVAACFTPGP